MRKNPIVKLLVMQAFVIQCYKAHFGKADLCVRFVFNF